MKICKTSFSFTLNVRNLPLSDGLLFLHSIMKAETPKVGYQRAAQLSVRGKIDETSMRKERARELTCLNPSTR